MSKRPDAFSRNTIKVGHAQKGLVPKFSVKFLTICLELICTLLFLYLIYLRNARSGFGPRGYSGILFAGWYNYSECTNMAIPQALVGEGKLVLGIEKSTGSMEAAVPFGLPAAGSGW